MLKSQDIVVLLRLISLWRQGSDELPLRTLGWQGWEREGQDGWNWYHGHPGDKNQWRGLFTVRQLAADTGISKSQVSVSLNRCFDSGLAFPDRKTDLPKANAPAVLGLLVHAVRFLFPVQVGPLGRGIPTAMSAPVLQEHLAAGEDHMLVWPSQTGNSQGRTIQPLIPSVPHAVKADPLLYAMLALTDSLRTGLSRERSVAEAQLVLIMNLPEKGRQ